MCTTLKTILNLYTNRIMEIAKYLNYCKNTKKDYKNQSSVDDYYEWAWLKKQYENEEFLTVADLDF